MKNILFIIFIIISSYLHAEITVSQSSDKFSPDLRIVTSTQIVVKEIGSNGFFDQTSIYLFPMYFYETKSNSGTFAFRFKYRATEWGFFNEVTFLIDGKTTTLPAKSISRDTAISLTNDVFDTEIFSIDIPEDLYKKIIIAKSVSIRFAGSKLVTDCDVKTEFLTDSKQFYYAAKEYFNATKQNVINGKADALITLSAGFQVTDMTTIPADAIRKHNLSSGVLVVSVAPGSIAERAGMRVGDIIKNFGFFQTVKTKEEVKEIVDEKQPGDHLLATVFHSDDGIFPTVLSLKF